MHVPEFFQKAIEDIGGKNLYGEPRYRVVWSKDRRWESGLLKGCPLYLWPDGREMECWILEVWHPPHFFGDPAEWNEDICGEFPYKGYYGIKSPLVMVQHGEFIALELNEGTLNSIRQKHLHDLEWSETSAANQLKAIIEQQTVWQKNRTLLADKEADDVFDHYHAHRSELDNADNRVFSMPKSLDVTAKNSKFPVR